jgi:transposase
MCKLRNARWKIALRFVRRYCRLAEVELLTADGVGTNEIMRRAAKSKSCVWRWQERFIEEGFDGLLRDKTRPSRIKPLRAETAERVVALALGELQPNMSRLTGYLLLNPTFP